MTPFMFFCTFYFSDFSTNHEAVQRSTLMAAYRAQARSNMEEFLSCRANITRHDLLPSRIRRDQSDVQATQEIVTSVFIYPFSEMELESLSSGLVSTEKDLLKVEFRREGDLKKFIEEQLVNTLWNFMNQSNHYIWEIFC